MLCSINEFKKAINKALILLEDDVLKSKNLSLEDVCHAVAGIKHYLEFLNTSIKDNQINDYEALIRFFSSNKTRDKTLSHFMGYLGQILDVIQLLKPNTARAKNATKYFEKNLTRTGHAFLKKEINSETRKILDKEIIESAALYIMLEISNLALGNSLNPISSLRNSMGDRLPEEYFSELLAGWFVEEIFIDKLKEKGFEIELSGIDSSRKILFKRPRNMGDADILIINGRLRLKIELQRVGNASKPNRIDNNPNTNYYKTYLKEHKIRDRNAKTILWIGDKPLRIRQSNSFLYDKICVINNHDISINSADSEVFFRKENIFIHHNYVKRKSFLSWDEFKIKSIEEVISVLNS
ncbi:MAG: hypothetical protein CMI58_06245 [Parcubacteria group bacterium]|nr:hypothetical protein [Parcubacteria group bacterium]